MSQNEVDHHRMQNGEILRRLQFILGIDDSDIVECFTLVGNTVSVENIQQYVCQPDTENYQPCSDEAFCAFLDGLIQWRRGPSEQKQRNVVALNNNSILKKIRIALELQARDLDNAFMLSGHEISPHEISALFRKPGTKHYVACSDEVFERLLSGLSLYFRS